MPTGLAAALADRYRVERELGGGGMSRVWVARELALDRLVVVKVVGDGTGLSAERFAREVQLAARLQQANIVPLLTAGDANGVPYYTMPYVDGQSLRARLARGALSPAEALDVLRDVARALAYAHGQGVVHRDIKPENILLSAGAAVVTDFGIAKALRAARTMEGALPDATAITQAGTSLGTPAYMAPEQALGEEADARADVYAWGVVAYELLAGRHPFAQHTTPSKLVAAHLSELPAALPAAVPAPLAALVLRCLAKEPGDRPMDGGAIVMALSTAATPAAAAVPASTGRAAHGAAPGGAVRGSGRVVAALGLLLAVLGGAWWMARTPAADPEGDAAPAAGAPAESAAASGSIAVLPFVNLGGNAQDEYFSDGLTDELANAIRNLPGLRLAGRSSSYAFKGKNVPATEIGRTLGVRTLVEGTVRRSGARVRLAAQLTRTANGEVLWSGVFENAGGDVFAVQDSFTRAIVAQLTPLLGAADGPPATRFGGAEPRGTDDAIAYDLYLRGRYLWAQRGAARLDSALVVFRQAVGRDPRFARGWAGLALTHVLRPNYDAKVAPRPAFDSALAAAGRALALDSTLVDAWSTIGLARLRRLEFGPAEQAMARARALDPQNATMLHWSAFLYSAKGDLAQAQTQREAALARDPLSATILNNVVISLVDLRRFDEARREGLRLNAMSPLFAVNQAFNVEPAAAILTGSAERVWGEQQRLLADPSSRAIVVRARGARAGRLLTAAATGRWPEARALRDSIAVSEDVATYAWDRAISALVFGTRGEAVQHFITSFEQEGAFGNLVFSMCAPILDLMQGEPAWQAFVARRGLPGCPVRRGVWPELRAPENRR